MSKRNGSKSGDTRSTSRSHGSAKTPSPQSARTVGDFWGDVERLPAVEQVRLTKDSSAVVRSLGRPPVSGHEAISEHYFRAVCDQAVNLAAVLATASELLSDDGEVTAGLPGTFEP